jgi:transposase InsO family protein
MFCELFGYSKQAYYKKKKSSSNTDELHHRWRSEVLSLRTSMPRLGTRKLHHLIKARIKSSHLKMGRDRLFTLLRHEGLLVERTKRHHITTNSKHWMRKYPNLTQSLVLTRPEQLWVADITYIATHEKEMYLHLVTDAYSKQIMGFELSCNMAAESTAKALKMGLRKRKYPNSQLMHHSDRGLQYCSAQYTGILKRRGITISMTENGDPYENAVAERINGILKTEFGLGETLQDIQQAREQTRESIAIYNAHRPHYSCDYLTPKAMHAQRKLLVKTYRNK